MPIASIIKPISYRPFDNQFFINHDSISERPRQRTTSQLLYTGNVSLSTCRQQSSFDFQHALIADRPIDMCFISLQTKETGYLFPLYVYHDDGTRTTNFDPKELKDLTQNLIEAYTPENILDYIYATLYSPSYRKKYKDLLKTDFPRIPIPTQDAFDRLVPLGTQLRELHLMKSPIIDEYETTFPVAGDCIVGNIKYDHEKVWINQTQFFGNVPQLAWNFYIGGYQPAQKWLKDRKGRQLSDHDLVHYQRIIKILLETDRLMKEIG